MAMIMHDSLADYPIEPGKPIPFAMALFYRIRPQARVIRLTARAMRGERTRTQCGSALNGELTLPRFMSRTHRVRKYGAAVD